MKKIFFILPILLMSVWLSAQTPFTATYTFSGTTGHVESFTYNGTTYEGISMGTINKVGVTSSSSTNNFRASGWPLGATDGSDVFTGSVDTGKYIGFTINAVSGYKFTVSTIQFGIGRSKTGTRQCQWRGSYDNYSSIINNYTTLNTNLTNSNGILTNPDANLSWTGNVLTLDSNYSNITTSCGFRLYMYNAEQTGGTAGLQGPITITGTFEQIEAVPMISLNPSTLSGFTMEKNTPSESKNYTLSGTNLTSDILITAPSGYQLSQDNINWVSSLSLAPDFNETIYVRLNGNDITSYNGNINHSSGEAEANLAVSGIVFEPTPDNLLLLDNFYYDTGLALKDTRWTAHSGAGTNSITVQSGNLTYEGYPSIAGNLISLTGSGEDVNRTFTAQTANSVYASFLVNVTSATTTGDYFIHFGINPFNTGLLYGRVYIKSTGTGTFDFGLSKTTDAAVYSGNNYNYGTTYLLVLKYEIVDGTNNDIISLFINPYILGTEPTPIISISPNSADIANIGAIAIRQGAAANAPTLQLDGIRVANSWENLFEISEQPPLPVVLTSFTAIISADNCIILNWTTESENGLVGYYIYRSTNDKLENAQLISQMITANNSSSQCIYTYEDNEVFDTTTYYYWLQSIELGGIANIYGPVSVYYGPLNGYPTPEVPFETVLQPIYPNPFNPIVFIPYTLAEATDLNFYIYNSRGQLIRHFYVGTQEPGYYRLSWDGKDSKGISCANGVYQIVMKAGKNVYNRKAALMK